ncbi:MAG: tetratricopeptide repeat protein [Bacteroidota bacterium]
MRHFIFLLSFLLLKSAIAWGQSAAAQEAYRNAVAAMDTDQPEKGFALIDKALQLQPNYYDALYARAFYHNEAGADEETIRNCNTLLAFYPKDTATYTLRGQAYLTQQAYDEAETSFRQALLLDSTDFQNYNDLAYACYLKEDYVHARESLAKSAALKPNGFVYEYQARMLSREGKYDLALKEVEKLLVLAPPHEDALRLKAQIFLTANKDNEAIKIYTLLQNQKKLNEQDLLNWGLIYYSQKKYPQALTYFSALQKHDEADLYYFKALSEYRIRQPELALQSIDQAIALIDADDEENAAYFYDRAIIKQAVSQKTGKPTNAAKDFLQAVYLVPEIIDQRDYNGDTLDLIGNAKHVLKGLYTSQQLDSARANGFQQRAEAYAERGLYTEALEEVQKAFRIDSTAGNQPDAYSYHLRGSYYLAKEQFAPAIRDLEKALHMAKNPLEDQTYNLRGLAYTALEMYQKALADFDKAIAINGQQAEYFYNRANAFADQKNLPKALLDLSKAIELQPSESEYWLSRSDIYLESKQFDMALEDCNHVIAMEADNADAYYYRGTIHDEMKNYALAIQDFTQALQGEPTFSEAQQALDEAMIKAGK